MIFLLLSARDPTVFKRVGLHGQRRSVHARDAHHRYVTLRGLADVVANANEDEIHWLDGRPPSLDVLGGAGSYTAVGARLFCGPPASSKAVGWIVDCGSDFPADVRATIEDWRTSCLMRETPERLTTRARNDYGANDFRGSSPVLTRDG
jgi:hypothetical protein